MIEVLTVVAELPCAYEEVGDAPTVTMGSIVYPYSGPLDPATPVGDGQIAVALAPAGVDGDYWVLPSWAVEPLVHMPHMDANGNPTEYAWCGVDAGRLSAASGGVTCARCMAWDEMNHDDADGGA